MSIVDATREYEQWLAGQTPLEAADLAAKHAQMRQSAFTFLRATFYRWAQVWPRRCPRLADAPAVLGVGDLHIENFGTWRDAEGRLAWGVNDFDEAAMLPYANDLVRLAVSARLAAREERLKLPTGGVCRAILAGYTTGLRSGGRPFVLAEDHDWLRQAAVGSLRAPGPFWANLAYLPTFTGPVPADARAALEGLLPQSGLPYRLVRRVAGEGSLGRPRLTALADWAGGRIAREVKALAPSAWAWANGKADTSAILYATILARAVRCPDPFLQVHAAWVVRRLGPDCSRVTLEQLAPVRDQDALLEAMGRETANIHLGTDGAADAISAHLKRLGKGWLPKAADAMADAVLKDWRVWRKTP